jgi:hypothetical protein
MQSPRYDQSLFRGNVGKENQGNRLESNRKGQLFSFVESDLPDSRGYSKLSEQQVTRWSLQQTHRPVTAASDCQPLTRSDYHSNIQGALLQAADRACAVLYTHCGQSSHVCCTVGPSKTSRVIVGKGGKILCLRSL